MTRQHSPAQRAWGRLLATRVLKCLPSPAQCAQTWRRETRNLTSELCSTADVQIHTELRVLSLRDSTERGTTVVEPQLTQLCSVDQTEIENCVVRSVPKGGSQDHGAQCCRPSLKTAATKTHHPSAEATERTRNWQPGLRMNSEHHAANIAPARRRRQHQQTFLTLAHWSHCLWLSAYGLEP